MTLAVHTPVRYLNPGLLDLLHASGPDREFLRVFQDATHTLEEHHVDGGARSPSSVEKIYAAMNGLASAWGDPFTRAVSPEVLAEERIGTEGRFVGVGIHLGMKGLGAPAEVISPIDGTPASRAGIRAGDVIVSVDGKPTTGLTLNAVARLIRGEAGTTVTLQIRRKDRPDRSIPLVRETIPVTTVSTLPAIKGIARIRISNFSAQTFPEFRRAVLETLASRPKGLVIDLRNNPGGLLDSCISIADDLLESGDIVDIRARNPRESERVASTPGSIWKGPVAVLVNDGSASAAEILAGALKDNHRAVIVGTRTYGKGSVQRFYPVGPGGGMYVTIARYQTPSGTVIDHRGLAPDVEVEGPASSGGADIQMTRAIGLLIGEAKR
jgi:carboxyl-terminal processing protease